MLAFARLFVGLLTLVVIGLFVHHMWPTGDELLLYQEFVQASEKCEAPPDEGQFIQTRTNGRRDFVQVEGKKAILTFPTSQIEMDRRGTLKEQLLQPAITALEPTAFANQIGFKTDIQGDSAVIDYRDSLLEVSQLKAKRSYGFLRLSHSTSFLKDSLSTYTHFTGTLTADYAKYHGNEWLLKGNFFATTPTGSLKADLLRGEGIGAEAKIWGEGEIQATLIDGVNLSGESGVVDLSSGQAAILGGEERARYLGKDGEFLKADEITVWGSKEAKNPRGISFDRLLAHGRVELSDGESVHGRGESLEWIQEDVQGEFCAKLLGSSEKGDGCLIENEAGDRLTAAGLYWDGSHFSGSGGVQAVFHHRPSDEPTHLSANEFVFDSVNGTLDLIGHARAHNSIQGSFYAENSLTLEGIWNGDSWTRPQCAKSTGLTKIHAIADEIMPFQELVCDGEVAYDRAKNLVEANSKYGQRLLLQGPGIELKAQNAGVSFDPQTEAPDRLTASGEVYIVHEVPRGRLPSYFQYVLSDRASYSLPNRRIDLKAKPGERVLLYDTSNELKMSANELVLFNASTARPFAAKGVGDVRFIFLDQELMRLWSLIGEKGKITPTEGKQ